LTKAFQDKIKQDRDYCLAAGASEFEKSFFEWVVDDKGGVGNVVVWLRPPQGQYFKVDLSKKTWKDDVQIDQPHCAFLDKDTPSHHCVVLFPATRDGGKLVPTGQKFLVDNSASINHNTKWGGAGETSGNQTLNPKQHMTIDMKPDYSAPLRIECNIHPWMRGYAWAFDHPYAAVTNPDGSFEIKDVPVGAPVQVVAWHEVKEFLNGNKGEPLELKAGETTKNFTMRYK